MRTQLSSSLTLVYRVVFPIFWIGMFGAGTLGLWLGAFEAEPDVESMKYPFLAAWLVGSTFILWFTQRLREVCLEGKTLVVRGLRGEERIPLERVWSVTESRLTNPKTIHLHVEPGAASTDRVVFLAPWGFQLPLTDHRVVKDLREAIARSRAAVERR